MSKINIAYTTEKQETFNYMLYVSIKSVLLNNINNFVNVYIVSSAIIDNETKKVFSNLENFHNCKINYIKEDIEKYNAVRTKIDFSKHFFMYNLPNLIDEKRVLYLDENSFVTGDLSNLFNMDLENYSCASVEYLYPHILRDFFDINKKIAHFGLVTLIDLENWRKQNIFKKMLFYNYFSHSNYQNMNYVTCFNVIINDCKTLELTNGYIEANRIWQPNPVPITFSKEAKDVYKKINSHITKPLIVTFVGDSPLVQGHICTNAYSSLWWKYAQMSPIYKEIKEFQNQNKYKLSATTAQNSFKYSWLLSRIFPYIKPYWFRILLGFLIAIPLGLLDGVTAFALKPYMDYVIGGKDFLLSCHGLNFSISSIQMAFILPVGVVLFALIQGVLRYLNDYISAWTSNHITNDVKFDLFYRLVHMHPQFFDENSSGIVISRYMSDPRTASAGIVDNIKTITTAACGALGLIAVMFYSSYKLAFIGVLVLCIAFVPVVLIRSRIKEASNKGMVIGGNITTNINETYSGNKVMTAYGLQDRQYEYFKKQTWNSYNVGMSLLKRAGWMSPLMYLIASFGIAAVLGVGTYLINSGQMTAGSFASFVTSLLLLYKPVKTLGNTLTGIQTIFVAMGRVFELFDLEPAIKEAKNPLILNGFNDCLEFKNVDFEYVPNQLVLKNLNLIVRKNETLAIVGNSGGGKSTLVNLIPRFYDIKSGSITIDGVDLKEFSLKSLRNNISMVFQDNFLFSGSIKENIMMGNPNATSLELMEAIKAAHLEDMIQELPDGLDTELGERGLTLSGGQRQRVAIARAMLRNAPIVILDEATSALDNESEAIVQKAMDNLMKDRTVFIIAHRLSTIKNADRIAVINEGELVEIGTHNELMSIPNGHYKALYEMQFKKQDKTTIL